MSCTPASCAASMISSSHRLEAADIGGDGVGEQLDVLRQIADIVAERVARPCDTSAPSSRTVPRLGCSTPTMWRASVDFPAPDGPMIPSASPASSRKDTLRRIGLAAGRER